MGTRVRGISVRLRGILSYLTLNSNGHDESKDWREIKMINLVSRISPCAFFVNSSKMEDLCHFHITEDLCHFHVSSFSSTF